MLEPPTHRHAISLVYGLAMVIAVALLPVQGRLNAPEVLTAIVLLVITGIALPQIDRLPRGAPLAGIAVYLVAVGLLRDGTHAGGVVGGGYSPLVLLPVIWVATRGRPRELLLALVGTAVVFAGPLLLIGAPGYPASGWRLGALTVVVALAIAARVTGLVSGLRLAAGRSDAILASMSEGFALTRKGAIVAVNPALCALTGYREDALLGTSVPFPFWPDDASDETDALRRCVVEPDSGEFELTLQRADGERFLASITTTSTPDGSLLSTFRDITQQRAHEEAMLRRADDLAAIAEVTRVVGHSDPHDARQTICQVARAVARATTATIWEADDLGLLHNTCMLGAPAPDFVLGPGDEDAGACVTMRVSRALFVADAPNSPRMDSRMLTLLGAASAYFQPIEGPEGARGVLALSWAEPLDALPSDATLLLEVLSAEAATALERDALLKRLESLSRTDDLTGLPNRRAWDELLTRERAVALRTGRPLAVAMLDLDHFKSYNDHNGHLAGDQMLRSAAAAWRSKLRETDVLARWGGEEFVLLLPGCDQESAGRLVDRLRGLLPDGVTFSAGVAGGDVASTGEQLVAEADAALYLAKASGRDRVVLAQPALSATDRA